MPSWRSAWERTPETGVPVKQVQASAEHRAAALRLLVVALRCVPMQK